MEQKEFEITLHNMVVNGYAAAFTKLDDYFMSESADSAAVVHLMNQKNQAYEYCVRMRVQGNAFATVFVGRCLEEGWGTTPKQYSLAGEAYAFASAAGNAVGDYYLGLCSFHHGRGVIQSDANAWLYFNKSAQKGYGPAEHMCGYMQFVGVGFSTFNYTNAMQMFLRASRNGVGEASCLIGFMHENGYGVSSPSDTTAKEWYRRGLSQGFFKASLYLRDLEHAKKFRVHNPFLYYKPRVSGLDCFCEPIEKTRYTGYIEDGVATVESQDVVDQYTIGVTYQGALVTKKNVPNYFRSGLVNPDRKKSKNPNAYSLMNKLLLLAFALLALALAYMYIGFDIPGVATSTLEAGSLVLAAGCFPCLFITACCGRVKLKAHAQKATANQFMFESTVESIKQADSMVLQSLAQFDQSPLGQQLMQGIGTMRQSFPGLSLPPLALMPQMPGAVPADEVKIASPTLTSVVVHPHSRSPSGAQPRQPASAPPLMAGQAAALVQQWQREGMVVAPGVNYHPPVYVPPRVSDAARPGSLRRGQS